MAELERRRARGEGLKCVDVVAVERVLTAAVVVVVVVVVDALTEEAAEEVSGCLFVVIVMRIITHVEVRALLVWIGIHLRSRNMLHLLLHLHPLQHQ
jgi:hypothetical protein